MSKKKDKLLKVRMNGLLTTTRLHSENCKKCSNSNFAEVNHMNVI